MAKANKGGATGTVATNGTGSWSDDPARGAKSAAHLAGLEQGAEETKLAKPMMLPRLDIQVIELTLVGDSELICHRFSAKAVRMILQKQMGQASSGLEPKDPRADYEDTLYPFPGGGYGFPTIAFKDAAVSACTSLGKAITKVQARQAFHVLGELCKIEGKPRMREDPVRLNRKSADIRHRAGFPEWSVTIQLKFNARVLTAEQIVNLFNVAGFAVGVGEWRPETDGQFGLFHVLTG